MTDGEASITIPIIDISGYLAGDVVGKAVVAAKVCEAYENQGFLQIVGHGVTQDLQSRFLKVVAAFFALPAEEKLKLSAELSPCFRGYERVGGQKLDELDESATPDQKEGFTIKPDRPLGRFLAGPNQWPDSSLPGMANFKETYMEYFWTVHELSKTMFRLIALSLGLDEDYFDDFASDPDGIQSCRSHHYPPTQSGASEQTRGVGAHTDFGALTLLLQDEIGGLEVLHNSTGSWHAVPPIKGAYVVNAGDLMQIWTNDRYKSTMHRVVSPLSKKDRYSCAFFNDGMLDKIVEALPGCVPAGEKPKYAPLRVEDHCIKRYVQSYGAGGSNIQAFQVVPKSKIDALAREISASA